MQVDIVSFARVFPATKVQTPQSASLSIIETFATHSTAEGLWFYDSPENCSRSLLLERLQKSLIKTLDVFPQYSGNLSINAETKPDGGHTERLGRIKLLWGTETDLGVGYIVAKANKRLSDIVPDADQRRAEVGGWDRSNLPTSSLLPATLFRPSLVTLLLQVTTFECGGFAIGLTTTHALMDGQCISLFVQHWAHTHNSIFSEQASLYVPLSPVFNPQLLDKEASGNIDGKCADPELVAKAHTLPAPHYETAATSETVAPIPTVNPLNSSKIFHFTAEGTHRIWEAANEGDGEQIGRQQALVAHVWSSINRARGFVSDERQMNLGMPLDLRRRLGLPASLMGSPVIHADIHLSGREICSTPLRSTASKIKSTFEKYDAEKLKALLHELSFEENPQRYAGHAGSLPPERSLVISIIPHMNFFNAEFEGKIPTLVLPLTVMINGLVMIMEGRPREGQERKHWCDDGVDIMMTLESDVMDKLMNDNNFGMPKA